MKPSVVIVVAVFLLVFLGTAAPAAAAAAAVACDPMELSSCAGAILTAKPPTATCCAKLKEQRPCFCQYKKNPNLKGYINSDNSKKVAKTCGVPVPTC